MPPKDTSNKIKILALGTSDEILELITSLIANSEINCINCQEEFDENFENLEDGYYAFIVCGSKLGSEFSIEAAQVLNCQCPSTPTFFITEDKSNFRPRELEKNGFNKAFLYPLDKSLIEEVILYNVKAENLKERHYKQIRIIDFEEGDKLDFDTYVFLPLNKKYVQFSSSKDTLSKNKIDKLKRHHIGAIHIDHKNAQAFYDYSAKQLKKLGKTSSMSATEREEKLTKAVSGLFSEIFDTSEKVSFDGGKSALANCQKIVSNYITNGMSNNWYSNLIRTVGSERGSYPHASEVSTYASLFAIGLEHPSPEDLALAGFLHDISLADFPVYLLGRPQDEWTEEQRELYRKHPENSINIIKRKKMILDEKVIKAILDHHEMYNGKGFPKEKSGPAISIETQILSFADQFQYLMTVQEGRKRLQPIEAFHEIEKTGSIGPEVLRKIKKLLTPPPNP